MRLALCLAAVGGVLSAGANSTTRKDHHRHKCSSLLAIPSFRCQAGEPLDGDDKIRLCRNNAALSMRGGSRKQLKPTNSATVTRPLSAPLRLLRDCIKDASVINFSTPTQPEDDQAIRMRQLESVPIQAVTAPNSTVLPLSVLQQAAKSSNLIGSPLQSKSVHDCAQLLQQWYYNQGYILHSVSGATLVPETGTAVLSVQEPLIDAVPVDITFAKEMIQHKEQIMTFREYRRKTKNDDLTNPPNITFVPKSSGRTRPQVLAKTLGLVPGQPFRWDPSKWAHLQQSGLFARILRASPTVTSNRGVQLQIMAQEPPSRNLAYGVTKSLYTGKWEGELNFEHLNLFGGGESLDLIVRRCAAKDAIPSAKLKFTNDKRVLGSNSGGYSVEVFRDSLGEERTKFDISAPGDITCRQGTSVRVQNLLSSVPSACSASVERTLTRTKKHEFIASSALEFGPVRRKLWNGRFNVFGSLVFGTQIHNINSIATEEESKATRQVCLLPYSSGTFTTRQIFPLFGKKPITLAMQHSIMTSTKHLPRHEATAAGFSSRVRGYSANGPISSSLVGTTEVRIPVTLPKTTAQDATIVLFGDWIIATPQRNNSIMEGGGDGIRYFRKGSVGIGLRKSIQGIPLRCDFSLTADGKIGAFVGLSADFDV